MLQWIDSLWSDRFMKHVLAAMFLCQQQGINGSPILQYFAACLILSTSISSPLNERDVALVSLLSQHPKLSNFFNAFAAAAQGANIEAAILFPLPQ